MNKYFLVYFFFFFPFVACTRFDSNKNNKRLIQATWLQVEITYPNISKDSLITESPEGITELFFTADSCFEQMNDLEDSIYYSYDIKDYVLKLEKDSSEISYLNIRKLTNDSLILNSDRWLWKYIKKRTDDNLEYRE